MAMILGWGAVREHRRGDAAPCEGAGAPGAFGAAKTAGVEAPRTLEAPETEEETDVSPDRLWNVIVWNDPINLMSYVTFVFQKLFGYSLQLATRLMLEVHNEGRSIVATVEREKAEYYVTRLHQHGLQATLEKLTG